MNKYEKAATYIGWAPTIMCTTTQGGPGIICTHPAHYPIIAKGQSTPYVCDGYFSMRFVPTVEHHNPLPEMYYVEKYMQALFNATKGKYDYTIKTDEDGSTHIIIGHDWDHESNIKDMIADGDGPCLKEAVLNTLENLYDKENSICNP